MRDLLMKVHPHIWSQISSVVFAVAFIMLILWVFMPSRKSGYEEYSRLPLDKE